MYYCIQLMLMLCNCIIAFNICYCELIWIDKYKFWNVIVVRGLI